MTLWRQVSIVIIMLLAAVFAGTFIISIHSMHRFLLTQMNSHAQDTASSLGLSISDDFAEGDMLTVSRTIDAIFDRGYYQRITVKDIKEGIVYDNVFAEEIENAPQWFRKIIIIPATEAESILMAGWRNIGSLHVTSHPGYAYFELWKICQDNFCWFFTCILVLMFGSLFVLHELLRPLRYAAEQAKAIANKNFIIQEKLPFTTEFRTVVETMNKMSTNLKEMFGKHLEFSEIMRERSFKDMLTGLGNKRFFEAKLGNMLSNPETSISGALLLVRLTEMGEYRNKWGYKLGDLLLKDVAAVLTKLLNEHNIPVLCHFGNYEFAIIFLNITRAASEEVAQRVLAEINALEQHEFVKAAVAANIGGVIFNHDNFTVDVHLKADNALRHSQKKGINNISIEEIEIVKSLTAIKDWPKFLQEIIAKQDIIFSYQPVFAYKDNATELFHNENLLRLKGPNAEILTSGVVMPMVEKYGLGVEVDKAVISLILDKIAKTATGKQGSAFNITEASLQDSGFNSWLSQKCARARAEDHALVRRLNIEVAENLVRKHLTVAKELFATAKIYGIKVGIDHFGGELKSFAYLEELKVDYIKIDGSYTRSIENLVDNQMIIRSFIEMGHSLGIAVLATAVETEAEKETLMNLHIDGMQGYFIAQPS